MASSPRRSVGVGVVDLTPASARDEDDGKDRHSVAPVPLWKARDILLEAVTSAPRGGEESGASVWSPPGGGRRVFSTRLEVWTIV